MRVRNAEPLLVKHSAQALGGSASVAPYGRSR
jgi:hypothetical protein